MVDGQRRTGAQVLQNNFMMVIYTLMFYYLGGIAALGMPEERQYPLVTAVYILFWPLGLPMILLKMYLYLHGSGEFPLRRRWKKSPRSRPARTPDRIVAAIVQAVLLVVVWGFFHAIILITYWPYGLLAIGTTCAAFVMAWTSAKPWRENSAFL